MDDPEKLTAQGT